MVENKLLIIIPAHNEADNIKDVVGLILRDYPQHDYLVVNDCSTDNTEKICEQNEYNYITLPINLGIGGAVQSGYKYARENGYDIAVQLDGDGQHDPQYIERLAEPIISRRADMVIGSRFASKEGFQSSAARRFGIGIIRTVVRMCCGVRITDATSGFRAVNRRLLELFAEEYAQDYPEPEAIVTAVLNGYKVAEEPVIMKERGGGISSINSIRSLYYILKVPLALIVYRLTRTSRRT